MFTHGHSRLVFFTLFPSFVSPAVCIMDGRVRLFHLFLYAITLRHLVDSSQELRRFLFAPFFVVLYSCVLAFNGRA